MLKDRLPGAVLVLACVALPLVLGQLSVAQESADAARYIRALGAPVALATPGLPAGVGIERPAMPAGHYFFLNGCVGPPEGCGRVDASYWGEYYAELARLYVLWGRRAGGPEAPGFAEWAKTHAHFIKARTARTGTIDIAQSLGELASAGEIHLVGTSVGGLAIASYLSRAMRGELALDRRIRSVLIVDVPLGRRLSIAPYDLVHGLEASVLRSDVQRGLGAWARVAGIHMLTVDTPADLVGHDPLPDVPNDAQPLYPRANTPPTGAYVDCRGPACQLAHLSEWIEKGTAWHMYTGNHLATSARQFVDVEWR